MNKSFAKTFVFLSMAWLVGACAHIPPASQDMGIRPMEVDPAKNPDVIWITRQIKVIEKTTGVPQDRYGLYACYRSTTPAEPTCYLAKTYISTEELVWPDNPEQFHIWEGNSEQPKNP